MLGAAVLLAHCGGSDLTLPADGAPASITAHDGDNQNGSAGAQLSDPIIVKVVNRRDEPVPGQSVAFSVENDNASITPQATTNADGLAQAEWVLGTALGNQSAVAQVVGSSLSVTFEASAVAAEPSRIERSGGHDQSAPIGSALPAPLVVLVTDQFGNPVADVEVDWSADDGSVEPESSTTGVDGLAQTTWTLGNSVGSQRASAASGDLEGSPVEFRATASPGSADDLVLVSGNNQSAQPGQQLPNPLVVRLVDRNGNGIAGRPVSWIVGAGGGSVAATTSTTGDDGEAEMRWTLGSSPGLNTLNAVVSGVGVVGFRATAVGGGGGGGGGGGSGPSRLEFRVQPSDTERDRDISPAVQVAVLDQNGDLVTDREFLIMLELTGDDSDGLEGDTVEGTRSGIATFGDLEIDEEGQYRLRASTGGLPAVESNVFRIFRDSDED